MEEVLSQERKPTSDVKSNPGGTPICSECEEASGVIEKIKKYFCSSCWIHHCNFRFRKRLLELGKPVKGSTSGGYHRETDGTLDSNPKENVMIYFDSTTAARALLNLIRDSVAAHLQGITEPNSEAARAGKLPFPFSFTILYLIDGVTDEGEVVGGSQNNETINFLQSWLEETRRKLPLHFPFPLVITTLEKSLSQLPKSHQFHDPANFSPKQIKDQRIEEDRPNQSHISVPNAQLQAQLCQILRNLKFKSSRLDFLQILRQRLLLSMAKEIGLQKVMLPEDQTSMAVAMFSIMSSGRGEQLAEQMNLVTRLDGVDFCRPMMELSSDDLRDYMRAAGLEEAAFLSVLDPKDPIDKKKKIDSMPRQCEDFIVTLQRDYPGTVPTLVRIGAKLQPPNRGTKAEKAEKCKLCQRRLKELDANGGSSSQTVPDLLWCYGCRSILNDMKRPELLRETFS